MTTTELHEILDDENRKLSLAELKQVIYELKQDSLDKCFDGKNSITEALITNGKISAFQIVLDLLEHLGEEK